MSKMHRFNSAVSVLMLAALTVFSVGCSKLGAGKLTGSGPGINPATDLEIDGQYHNTRTGGNLMRAGRFSTLAGDIDITPVAGDSVYIYGTLADLSGGFDWQAKVFWGLLKPDGHIDRVFRRQVPASGESYTFLPIIHRGELRIPMLGAWTVNGVAITAVDHTKYGDWFTFRVSRDGAGNPIIDPIRDDFSQYGWYKLVVTGVEPDSVQYSKPVTGDMNFTFFATHTRLASLPMIYDGSAWVQYVWAKPGALILVRVNKPDGSMWIPGVFLENASGQRRLLTNVMDVDDTPSNPYYPVMPATLGADGKWTVPNPGVDNRWVNIGIGT